MHQIHVKIHGKNINAVLSHDEKYFYDQWKATEQGAIEPNTYKVFNSNIDETTVYIDLGAYIGTTCLYAAQLAKESFAFEPDPVAFDYLKANVEANPGIKNLTIYPYAVGLKEGTVYIKSKASGANSGSSLLLNEYKSSWETKIIDINRFIDENVKEGKLFIKIDIEGYEYTLMIGLDKVIKKYRPSVLLALHPQILANTVQGNSILKKMKRRFILIKEHIKLLRSIALFNNIRRVDGSAVTTTELLKEIISKGGLQEKDKELFLSF